MVSESWFSNLWKFSKKHDLGQEKAVIGVVAFEVASLMSKLIHLWQSLSDTQVAMLREEITNSAGIKKLVSDDEDYIVKLMCCELLESFSNVARSVSRMSKKCSDPILKSFEQSLNDMCRIGVDPYGWLLSMKKMEKNLKKMERLIVVTANLYQEMDALGDLEQTLKRINSCDNADIISLVEYEKRVSWKQHEVKRLKQVSIWNKTYDYVVLLLATSLFTTFCRIGHVFGINYVVDIGVEDSQVLESDNIPRSRSMAFMQASVHPSENNISRLNSVPLGGATSQSGPIIGNNNKTMFSSGPLGSSRSTSSPSSEKHETINFYSGPLGKSTTKSGLLARASKSGSRLWQSRNQLSYFQVKKSFSKSSKLKTSGPFNGCMTGGIGSSTSNFNTNMNLDGNNEDDSELHSLRKRIHGFQPIFSHKNRLLNAPQETLGGAALALHYANVIIVIEKLVASPHLIGQDAREDLYNMLPSSIRNTLKVKLKPYAKTLTYDPALAAEWNEATCTILDWLSPLAHNMIRWQSERSYEHQNFVSKTNVLLVQTLYFANQEKTEATVTELLLGLNYVWRFSKELNAAATECTSGRTFDGNLET